jgi:hypothetical protein
MKTKKVMKLIDPERDKIVCTVCGRVQWAELKPGGKYSPESWHCQNRCKLESMDKLQLSLLIYHELQVDLKGPTYQLFLMLFHLPILMILINLENNQLKCHSGNRGGPWKQY